FGEYRCFNVHLSFYSRFTLAACSPNRRLIVYPSQLSLLGLYSAFTRPLLGAIQPYVSYQPAFRATNQRMTPTFCLAV
ncbi:MAG: hypothetical protein VXA34_09165, partial [Gammaproteobacteria bacterium]